MKLQSLHSNNLCSKCNVEYIRIHVYSCDIECKELDKIEVDIFIDSAYSHLLQPIDSPIHIICQTGMNRHHFHRCFANLPICYSNLDVKLSHKTGIKRGVGVYSWAALHVLLIRRPANDLLQLAKCLPLWDCIWKCCDLHVKSYFFTQDLQS